LCSCWTYAICPLFDLWGPRLTLLYVDFLCSAAGPHTTIDGKEVVNFASANYLGLIGNEKITVRENCNFDSIFDNLIRPEYLINVSGMQDSCVGSLEKYGVGSCGPRGFYGTIG
jgi:serine palmitoyltransferase